jgi:hypothetical protein
VSPQQASIAPVLDCGSCNAEPLSYLLDRQQSEDTHPLTTIPQAIMPPDVDDCHHRERSSHPWSQTFFIQNGDDLSIRVLVQQPINFADNIRGCLPQIRRAQSRQ